MSKYLPLWQNLQTRTEDRVELSFDDIKETLGFPIDHSFLNYKKELLDYGYQVQKIYLKEKKIAFEKYKTT
jgi:hypothetical protein